MPTTRLTPPHPQWEYHVISLNTVGLLSANVDIQSLYTRLNELGQDGWELVSAAPISAGQGYSQEVLFVLKRPLR
ncbi:MAG: DUF4177 domain-containing protein [Roseiflexaceae bacterium]|nr:DUF4177 domain-containing protein [Roseiflexaceae bacterium]